MGKPPYVDVGLGVDAIGRREMNCEAKQYHICIYGDIHHAPCILRWLEKHTGFIFIALDTRDANQITHANTWGVTSFLAPFEARLCALGAVIARDASRRQHLNATREDSLLGFSLSAEDRAIIAESVKTHREEENEAEGEGLLASPSEPLKSPESDSDEEEEWVKKAKGKVLSRLLPDLLPEAPQRPREPRLESAGYAFYVDEKVEREIGLFLGRTAGGPKGTALEGQENLPSTNNVFWTFYTALGPESSLASDMSKDAAKVLDTHRKGLAVSANLSEAVSVDVLGKVLGARLTHAEKELDKVTLSSSSKLDYRLKHKNGMAIGVSVTRAAHTFQDIKGPNGCLRLARYIVQKKMNGVVKALASLEKPASCDAAIVHIWCASQTIASALQAEVDSFLCQKSDTATTNHFNNVKVVLTVADFGDVAIGHSYLFSGAYK